MIPKKFKKLSNNKLLNFSKVFELKLTEFHYEKDLNKFGYQSVSNSPIEIMDAIFEMNSLVDQKKVRIKDTELQNRFWKIFYKFYKIKRPKVLRICDTLMLSIQCHNFYKYNLYITETFTRNQSSINSKHTSEK